MPSYIPSALDAYAAYMANAYTKITAAPTDFGATAEEVIPFAAAQEAFAAAFAITQNPDTRTRPALIDRDEKRDTLTAAFRELAAIMQASPVMTDPKREQIGLPIRDTTPTPIGVPTTTPELTITAVNGRLLNLRLRNAGSTRRGKPAGVRGAWLYSYVGEESPSDFNLMKFEGATTRTDPQIVIDEGVAPGSKVWVSACWVNPTDQPGQACLPVPTLTGLGASQVKKAA